MSALLIVVGIITLSLLLIIGWFFSRTPKRISLFPPGSSYRPRPIKIMPPEIGGLGEAGGVREPVRRGPPVLAGGAEEKLPSE